jgi:hypothetical protein
MTNDVLKIESIKNYSISSVIVWMDILTELV